MIGHLATVTFYRVAPETIAILTKVAGLYRWLSPDYPEDLAFYRADEACLLASVAHEKDARFEGDLEIDDIKVGVPGLKVAKHDRDARNPLVGSFSTWRALDPPRARSRELTGRMAKLARAHARGQRQVQV